MPRKAVGDVAMTGADRAKRSRTRLAEEIAALRSVARWVVANVREPAVVAQAKAALGGAPVESQPMPLAPEPPVVFVRSQPKVAQTLARDVVEPRFRPGKRG